MNLLLFLFIYPTSFKPWPFQKTLIPKYFDAISTICSACLSDDSYDCYYALHECPSEEFDDCGYCVGGGTDLEENFADVGCGCNEEPAKYYCVNLETDEEDCRPENSDCECCDCVGGDLDEGWENCDLEIDVNLICEADLQITDLEILFGCSNDRAENYYCDQTVNECISFGTNMFPPCNFIDDGSCIIYGCQDPLAQTPLNSSTEHDCSLLHCWGCSCLCPCCCACLCPCWPLLDSLLSLLKI